MEFEKSKLIELKEKFDSIINTEEKENIEFWYARDLQIQLGYTQWRNFLEVINKARISCESAGISVCDHFAKVSKMIKIYFNILWQFVSNICGILFQRFVVFHFSILRCFISKICGSLYFNFWFICFKPHIYLTKISHKLWTCHELTKPRSSKCFSFCF